MNMANMDHRGALQGSVRDGNGGAVTDATVKAVNMDNGAEFTAMTDAQGNYAFGALPVGKYEVHIARDGVTVFRQRGVNVEENPPARVDIRLDAASASQAADFDRQDLLNKIASLEKRISDLESTTVLSEPETRVRRVEVFVDENGNEHDEQVPGSKPKVTYRRERTYRPPDDQRKNRRRARRCGQAQRDRRCRCGDGHAVRDAHARLCGPE
jgi:hypothetical protein